MSPYRAKPPHKHRWGYVWGERIGCVECRAHASRVRSLVMDMAWLLGAVNLDNTPSLLAEDARRWRERDELDRARGA